MKQRLSCAIISLNIGLNLKPLCFLLGIIADIDMMMQIVYK